MSNRSRNFALISYIDSEEKLMDILISRSNIVYYSYIYHDKDTYEDGTLKEPHYHIALILRCARNVDCVCNYFRIEDKNGLKCNCLGQITHNNKDIVTYFTHESDEKKYHYNKDEIKSNNIDKFYKDDIEDTSMLIIDDLLKRTSIYEMCKRYGKEFIYRYNNYRSIVSDILIEEQANKCYYYENFS